MNPKDYLPVHEESRAFALKMCGMTGGPEAGTTEQPLPTERVRWETVTRWADRSLRFDHIYASKVARKKGVLPDLNRLWSIRMGICLDIASMVTGMLRACGIDAHMWTGYARVISQGGRSSGKQAHAWVEATIDGRTYRYDHEAQGRHVIYQKMRRY